MPKKVRVAVQVHTLLHAAIELYAEVFEQENALDKLEAFASLNGPTFLWFAN